MVSKWREKSEYPPEGYSGSILDENQTYLGWLKSQYLQAFIREDMLMISSISSSVFPSFNHWDHILNMNWHIFRISPAVFDRSIECIPSCKSYSKAGNLDICIARFRDWYVQYPRTQRRRIWRPRDSCRGIHIRRRRDHRQSWSRRTRRQALRLVTF